MASPEEMAQTMRENVAEKTGKPISDWFNILTKCQLEKHGQLVKFIKEQHGVTHGFANLIVSDFLNRNTGTLEADDLVLAQYNGDKKSLKAIYDAVIDHLADLEALEISPKKTYVSLRHKKQFALIQPTTKTRVDIGINLKDEPSTERLELAGSFNSMVSHRVRISDVSQVDDELIGWLRLAYSKS